jgi:hypothetical protein
MQHAHDDVFRHIKLPGVGQIVRSKKFGTLWRVMEKREIWQNTEDDSKSGYPRLLPAIYLAYWRVEKGVLPGLGKMLGYSYTLHDNTFAANWEIVEE